MACKWPQFPFRLEGRILRGRCDSSLRHLNPSLDPGPQSGLIGRNERELQTIHKIRLDRLGLAARCGIG